MRFSARNPGLDVLRGVAILLVLAHHTMVPARENGQVLHEVGTFLKRGGWIGVDLFFVLSGFLVSGLLFKEYRSHRSVDLGRFLIRRGFKIYPAFWFLVLVTCLMIYRSGENILWKNVLAELLFVQNYWPSLCVVTWSLAVEEHFYLFLCLAIWPLCRGERSRLHVLPWLFLGVACVCLAFKLRSAQAHPYHFFTHLFPTHLRIDSLFFGTIISYYWHFHHAWLSSKVRSHLNLLWLCGAALLLPAFLWDREHHPFVYILGFNMFYMGAGCWVLASLKTGFNHFSFHFLAFVGRNSYAIYLWHLAVAAWIMPKIKAFFPLHPWIMDIVLYYSVSILFGYLMTLLIENPFLRLRDKKFPSRLSSPALHLLPSSPALT